MFSPRLCWRFYVSRPTHLQQALCLGPIDESARLDSQKNRLAKSTCVWRMTTYESRDCAALRRARRPRPPRPFPPLRAQLTAGAAASACLILPALACACARATVSCLGRRREQDGGPAAARGLDGEPAGGDEQLQLAHDGPHGRQECHESVLVARQRPRPPLQQDQRHEPQPWLRALRRRRAHVGRGVVPVRAAGRPPAADRDPRHVQPSPPAPTDQPCTGRTHRT